MPLKLNAFSGGSVTLSPASTASDYTLTLPAVTDTVVGLAATQTLTNKTLTTPTITTATITSPSISNPTITGSGSIVGSFPELFQTNGFTTTSTDRSLSNSTSWTDHLTIAFTTTKIAPVYVSAVFAMSYEAGAVAGEARAVLIGPSTYTGNVFAVAQQSDNNRARGAHSFTYMFGNVAVGSYTAYLQVRNNGAAATTWILNYYLGFDSFSVNYT